MNTEEEKLLTLDELSHYLNVSKRTVYRLLNNDRLPCFRIGGHLRFRREEIEDWLEGRRGDRTRDRKPSAG